MEFDNFYNVIFFIVPALLLLFMIVGTKKRTVILKQLSFSNKKRISFFKIFFITLGSLLVVVALLSPQIKKEENDVEVRGLNIYALIDISRSMMTEDIYPNRLEAAKRSLDTIVQSLKGDRIGFIPFSDSAYIQMPLTDDYSITKNYIEVIDSNLISGGGTQLYQALQLAEKSFNEIESNNKTVIIFSDGGDYDKKSLEFAKKNKIDIYSVGIGSEAGSVIPEYKKGKKIGFIKDKDGSAVVSKLNTDFLKELSKENNGKYYEVNNLNDESKNFIYDISNLKRENQRNEKINTYTKYYQIPLFLGFIFILIGYLLKEVIKNEE